MKSLSKRLHTKANETTTTKKDGTQPNGKFSYVAPPLVLLLPPSCYILQCYVAPPLVLPLPPSCYILLCYVAQPLVLPLPLSCYTLMKSLSKRLQTKRTKPQPRKKMERSQTEGSVMLRHPLLDNSPPRVMLGDAMPRYVTLCVLSMLYHTIILCHANLSRRNI